MEVKVGNNGNLNLIVSMPAKKFKSGKDGWFHQGIITLDDGTKVRVNLQAYKQ